MKRLAIVTAWLLLNAGLAQSDIIQVPGDQPTIAAAIAVSAPGDEIRIAAGTYAVSAEHVVAHGGLSFVAEGTVVLTGSTGAFFALTTETSYELPVRFVGLRFEGNYEAIGTRLPESPWHPTHVEIEDCVFTGSGHFYAVRARNLGNLSITGSRFEGANGGVYSIVSGLAMQDCIFLGQTGPALSCEDYAPSYPRLVEDCLFAGGRSSSAAITTRWGDNLTFRRCTFADNGLAGSSVFLADNSGSLGLEQCIVAGNHGRAFDCDAASIEYRLTCCDVWDNAEGDWFACLVGGPAENGNISADPLFCYAAGGNFGLAAGSPCAPEGNGCGVQIGAYGVTCGATGVDELAPAANTSLSAVKSLY